VEEPRVVFFREKGVGGEPDGRVGRLFHYLQDEQPGQIRFSFPGEANRRAEKKGNPSRQLTTDPNPL
jgi:hypothetical protein